MINYHWSWKPGEFLNKKTGKVLEPTMINGVQISPKLKFTGTVREWYETFVETIVDVRNACIRARKLPTGNGKFELRCGADVITILECSVLYNSTDRTLGSMFTVKPDTHVPNSVVTIGEAGRKPVGSVTIKDFKCKS